MYRKELPVGALIGGGTLDFGQPVHDYAQVKCPLATRPKCLVTMNLNAIECTYMEDAMIEFGGPFPMQLAYI